MDDKREGAKENVNFSVPGHVGKRGQLISFPKKEKDKGKMQFLRKPYVRPSVQRNSKAKLILETRRMGCQGNRYGTDSGFRMESGCGMGNVGPSDGPVVNQADIPYDEPPIICVNSKAAQFWIDIGPKEVTSEEGVDGTVFGSDVSTSRTRVVETNFSNSRIRSPVAEGGLGSRSGSQIEENRVEEEKHSNEEGYNRNTEGGTVIPKKRRKKELEDEVARVIETAMMLGLDIKGREKEIREVVARRGLEDEVLFAN
ncbi:hypothetical protein Q3G72_008703 [Acer saccharum]|nr:hypothetical protein Q3G72_008703 [Acer saccharum]